MFNSHILNVTVIIAVFGICGCLIIFSWVSWAYLCAIRELKQHFLAVRQEYAAAVENIEDVVISLARAIDAKDRYTEGHTERVSQYALFLGERMGMNEKQLKNLRIGALIHDIGKIGIDQNVLNKTSPLTPGERQQIESHPILGADICHPLNSLHDAMLIIRNHHEKMDGSGYPDGLKGDEIPLEVRIVTIVDIFDALTTDRSYRSALSINEALSIIRQEADEGKLDPVLVREFEIVLQDMFSMVKDA
ncbi:HD-GYP domain-containing protein [Syntrophomonas curvata]